MLLQLSRQFAVLALLIGCTPPAQHSTSASIDYERYVVLLAESSTNDEVREALDALRGADVQAFPALVRNLNNRTPAKFAFFAQAAITRDGDVYRPTIGNVCFDLIQEQIEGIWPKTYHDYHALNDSNVSGWFDERRDMTLHDLQWEAQKSSIERVSAEGDTEWAREVLQFLQEEHPAVKNSEER